jgi:hypothetical protein
VTPALLAVLGVVVGAFVLLYGTTLLERLIVLSAVDQAPVGAHVIDQVASVPSSNRATSIVSPAPPIQSSTRHVRRIRSSWINPRRHRPVRDDART